MRILLIHQYFLRKDQGGGQRFNEFVKFWSNKGAQIDVITGSSHYLGQDGRSNEWFEHDNYYKNVNVWRCTVSRFYHKGLFGRVLGYLIFVFSSLYVLIFKVEKKYDIIIATSPPLTVMFIGLISRFIKSGKLVFEIRDLWPDVVVDLGVLKSKTLISIIKKFEFWFYCKADFINVLSPDFKSYLLKEYNIDTSKIWFIPNGGDDGLNFSDNNKEPNDFVVVYAGAMSLVNAVSELLDVAQATLGLNVSYVLIGDGSEKENLKERVEQEGLYNVKFYSLLNHSVTMSLINDADVGVVTYQRGQALNMNYTNKMFDYLSCSKPVLLSLTGASKDFIENYECGKWVLGGDVNAWTTAILKLKSDPVLCEKMGENGLRVIKAEFNRKNLALEYLNLFDKAIN